MSAPEAAARSHLVLSPHPDDGVWSVGGQIAVWSRRREPVTVITVFDGEAAVPPGQWRGVAEPSVRRREDIAALACLRVRRISLGLPEAALRTDRGVPRYANPVRLFGRPHEKDWALSATVADAIRALADAGVVLHVPLAAGRHVDHVLVRRAAGLLTHGLAETRYYEDFPYRLREADHEGMRAGYDPVDLPRWLRAARCYRSQIAALFDSPERFERALIEWVEKRGERAGSRYAGRFWTERKENHEHSPRQSCPLP